MKPEFWHDRWQRGAIGFHRPDTNPALERYWSRVAPTPPGRVLVPLAGKSHDMHWLSRAGYSVMGVELSPLAVEAFFTEAGWEPSRRQEPGFEVYESHGIELWCGDVFDLPARALGDISGFYDRAALIALPPETRRKYAQFLITTLPAECRGLLVALDYGPDRPEGPPFSVPEDEVRHLFGSAFEIELFERGAPEEAPGGLRSRGIESVTELVFGVQRG